MNDSHYKVFLHFLPNPQVSTMVMIAFSLVVSLLLLPASAQVENTRAFTTLSCQQPPGSPNHQVYASATATNRCACITPAEAASNSAYVRCRTFNFPHYYSKMKTGVAACDESTGKCTLSCNSEYDDKLIQMAHN
jgi:hypothetical protein